jgi:hypothetical protein
MAAAIIIRLPHDHTPCKKAHNNQLTYYATILVVKTRTNYHYYYFYDLLHHDASTNQNQCDRSSSIVMVVPPMHCIGSNIVCARPNKSCAWIAMPSILGPGEHDSRNHGGIVWYSRFLAQNGLKYGTVGMCACMRMGIFAWHICRTMSWGAKPHFSGWVSDFEAW